MPSKLRDYTYIGVLSMVVLGLFRCGIVSAQDHFTHTRAKPATLMQGYGDLHHPVSTENAQAQQFFDQGLRQIYAFNHDEAARSFQDRKSTRLNSSHVAISYAVFCLKKKK